MFYLLLSLENNYVFHTSQTYTPWEALQRFLFPLARNAEECLHLIQNGNTLYQSHLAYGVYMVFCYYAHIYQAQMLILLARSQLQCSCEALQVFASMDKNQFFHKRGNSQIELLKFC